MLDKDTYISILNNSTKYNFNNKYSEYINSLSDNFSESPNIILYGPAASGKYTDALKIISIYSYSNLNYEKKMFISSSKTEHIIKISDIHYEINFDNLTCNSKILFNDIYNNIVDSIELSSSKTGIILCKNFHNINNELLDIFYSYMQKTINGTITIKFLILTEHLSFLGKNILDTCKVLYYSKLSISNYIKLSNSKNKKLLSNMQKTDTSNSKCEINDLIYNLDNINILKYVDLNKNNLNILNLKQPLCDSLISIILHNDYTYMQLRNVLYDILIFNLDIYECIFYILESIIMKRANLPDDFINAIYFKTIEFFKYYNNNYRPIYHLESYVLYIIRYLHEDQ